MCGLECGYLRIRSFVLKEHLRTAEAIEATMNTLCMDRNVTGVLSSFEWELTVEVAPYIATAEVLPPLGVPSSLGVSPMDALPPLGVPSPMGDLLPPGVLSPPRNLPPLSFLMSWARMFLPLLGSVPPLTTLLPLVPGVPVATVSPASAGLFVDDEDLELPALVRLPAAGESPTALRAPPNHARSKLSSCVCQESGYPRAVGALGVSKGPNRSCSWLYLATQPHDSCVLVSRPPLFTTANRSISLKRESPVEPLAFSQFECSVCNPVWARWHAFVITRLDWQLK